MFKISTLGLFTLLAISSPTYGVVYTFDAAPNDTNWTNGPNFPNAGTVGANWNGGQLAPPDGGPGGNAIDYQYNGHTWNIDNSNVSEDVQIKLMGGALNVSNSSLSLLPSSANTGATLSGLNLGQVVERRLPSTRP